jgi:glycosidase
MNDVAIPVPFPSPGDWRNCWIYFLLTDRFNNDTPGHPRPNFSTPSNGFLGGTFNGIRARLDYIKGLGAGAIWLTPVQKNLPWEETYPGYGIHDYLAIDPRYASDVNRARRNPTFAEGELRQLIDAAHARGLYVIFDIVLNHVGNVFGYASGASSQANSEHDPSASVLPIYWRNEHGVAAEVADVFPANRSQDALVWPEQFQSNDQFRRLGKMGTNEQIGDFGSLKQLVTDSPSDRASPVCDLLIRCHQYLIAKYDIDGFRIDTLKHIDASAARIFGNAMREFALSVGKTNFFTFGEIADDCEDKVATFIGRDTRQHGDVVGVDATLDFPLARRLPFLVKNVPDCNGRPVSPWDLANLYVRRKRAEDHTITSHGEASQYFVTFLDNHDNHDFRFSPPDHALVDQIALGVGCLFCLQGIPCLYYGTEQGLSGLGPGTGDAGMREALWAKANAFDVKNAPYRAIADIASVRAAEPALRYGRQYFRQVSGDGVTFAVSTLPGGILAFSRILNDREVVIVANPQTPGPGAQAIGLFVLVDSILNRSNPTYQVAFGNQPAPTQPRAVQEITDPRLAVTEVDGSISRGGRVQAMWVSLRPIEIQILTVT